jgi:hypothetical protein
MSLDEKEGKGQGKDYVVSSFVVVRLPDFMIRSLCAGKHQRGEMFDDLVLVWFSVHQELWSM